MVVRSAPQPGTSTPNPQTPALYDCVIRHTRTSPVRHAFRHRTYLWLVDLAHPPQLPWSLRMLARFDARDHFDGTSPTIRAALDTYLASQNVHHDGGRVLMLAHARVLGYVFNPLTLYWCHDRTGALVCVVAEVHNTYGQRHAYLLGPGATGGAEVAKDFYVSPFFPVDGHYRMRLPVPDDRLALTIQLSLGAERPFTATVRGRRRPGTARALLAATARRPWPTLAVWAGIRRHGIHLYLRGLPVQPRPAPTPTEGPAL
ncbi:DUF1365 domain-containing protein [Streptomyces sp. NBC_00648]|uniref:DUF1365 domain-containing protein n=1 Tax=Streptomyces sp. NBC_00648 TaxID=2975797 RepID=UPI00324D6308